MGGQRKLQPRLNYVYLVRLLTGEPFYIGKGTGSRWKRHDSRARDNWRYADALEAAGGDLPVSIVADNLTEADAFEIENILTKAIGIISEGGPLVNRGHGGEGGPVGVRHSKERREHRSRIMIALWQDENYRAKMLRPDRNRSGNSLPRSDEFKAVVSEKMKGNTHTLGYKHTDESRIKMSLKRKGKPKSSETRARMSASHLARLARERLRMDQAET